MPWLLTAAELFIIVIRRTIYAGFAEEVSSIPVYR